MKLDDFVKSQAVRIIVPKTTYGGRLCAQLIAPQMPDRRDVAQRSSWPRSTNSA
jgi:hypothetical protein